MMRAGPGTAYAVPGSRPLTLIRAGAALRNRVYVTGYKAVVKALDIRLQKV